MKQTIEQLLELKAGLKDRGFSEVGRRLGIKGTDVRNHINFVRPEYDDNIIRECKTVVELIKNKRSGI